MDSKKKQLVYAIVKFLDQEKGFLTEDLGESVEVAQQCLESVYGVSSADDGNKFNLPGSLQDIFNCGLSALPEQPVPDTVEASPESKAEADGFKTQGNDCMRMEKYDEAIDFYSKAIEKDNANAVYYCNRAAAHSKLNHHQEAIADCQISLLRDPAYSKAYGRMGLAHSALNEHTNARDCYNKAVELDPENESYKQNLELSEQKIRESSPGVNVGGMDFGGLLSNPNLMNMATGMMQNPQLQSMMANMMSGMGQGGQGGPEGLGGLLQAGQQLAQQMQQSNPELVDQLRAQMGNQDQQPPQPPPSEE